MEMRKLSERLALTRTVRQLRIKDADAVRVAYRLVCETTRRRNLIDKFVNHALKPATLDELDLGVQAFLRLYVYLTRIARNWGKPDAKEAASMAGLTRSILGWEALQPVEPVLGNLLTQTVRSVFEGASDEERVGLCTFHPTWFVKYCFKLFGRSQTLVLLEANNRPLPTYITLNTLKADEKGILDKLTDEGVKTEKIEPLRNVHEVTEKKTPLSRTASHRNGLFSIQDKAGSVVAEAANPQPGMVVLDVCAAPGAVTTCLAQLMQNKGAIYSVDYSRRRMRTWKAKTEHLGIEIAEPVIADASKPLPFKLEADVVVLDPPSTSTGTFARMPSAKWRLTPLSFGRMAELQWQMLNNCADHVKPKGTLVYTTSSIAVEENETLIERFLKWHAEYTLTEITPAIGSSGLRGLARTQRLLPYAHRCNGSFIAKLTKE